MHIYIFSGIGARRVNGNKKIKNKKTKNAYRSSAALGEEEWIERKNKVIKKKECMHILSGNGGRGLNGNKKIKN